MANPADPGEFELWITDRIFFQNVPPKTGDTGTFEAWITDRIYFEDYVEQAAVTRIPRHPAQYNTLAIY